MNQQERDALREKHEKATGYLGYDVCAACGSLRVPYPCDVIQVLDWAEALLYSKTPPEPEWQDLLDRIDRMTFGG
jgi:hypothetical protein